MTPRRRHSATSSRRGRQERRAGLQRHADHVQVNAGQGAVEVVGVVDHQPVAAGQLGRRRVVGVQAVAGGDVEPQQQRSDAALEVFEDRLVGGGQVRVGVLLAEVPAGLHGPERPGAADERRQPREPVRVVLAGPVAPGVDRLDVDAFVGVGDELLLERCPFQVGLGQGPPLVVAGRREVVSEGEFGGKHVHFIASESAAGSRR